MIVVDNFIEDEILQELANRSVWDYVVNHYTWYDCSQKPSNIWEELINEAMKRLSLPEPLGFEYWANDLSEGEGLPWHHDKDEKESGLNKKIVTSEYSCVFYGFPSKFWGGMLEIPVEDTRSEVERIAPKYNRIVMMPKDLEHRVTKIWTGNRLAFSFGAWNKKPWLFSDSDKIETSKLQEWVYGEK
jgi:hypothetical protein